MKIINLKTHNQVSFKSWKFPGGEWGVRILDPIIYHEVNIIQRINSSDNFFELAIAVDALRRVGVKKINLTLPYVPYARQDRVMTVGESLSIKVFADLLNSLNFDSVNILDPHSSVTPALINNVVVNNNHELVDWSIKTWLNTNLTSSKGQTKNFMLVAPDAGASKKIEEVAKYIGYERLIITGKKNRELSTGKITHTSIDMENLSWEPACFIVDDICDGGRTFIELAKVLRQKGASEVYLIVTHGIFSAGFEELGQHLDGIYTTNSFRDINPNEWIKNHKPIAHVHEYIIY